MTSEFLKFTTDRVDTHSVNGAEHDRGESGTARRLLAQARQFEVTDPARARQFVQDARRLARRDGDRHAEGESLYRLAALAHYDGEPGDAFALAIEAEEFADVHQLVLVRAWSLHLVGLVHIDSGNHAEALAQCLRALSLYRSTDHRVDEGNILNTIATIHHESGDADRAIVNYEAALAANEPYDRGDIDAMIVANVASLRSERGEHDDAVVLAERALESCRESAPGMLPEVLVAVANVLAARDEDGDVDRARRLLADARSALDATTVVFDDLDRSRIELTLGRIERRAGRMEQAVEHLRQSLELAVLVDARVQQLEAHTQLAQVFNSLGRFAEAVPHLEARFEIQARIHADAVATRMRTLQIAHEADQARRRSEITQLRLSVVAAPSSARKEP